MEDFREIIKYAIDREKEAQVFYRAVAAKNSQGIIRDTFLELAEEEKQHEIVLCRILEQKEPALQFSPTADYGLTETITPPILSETMTLADVFAIAMHNEKMAMEMYRKLAADSTSPKVRQIFGELATMEQAHKLKMEQFYTDVAYGESW